MLEGSARSIFQLSKETVVDTYWIPKRVKLPSPIAQSNPPEYEPIDDYHIAKKTVELSEISGYRVFRYRIYLDNKVIDEYTHYERIMLGDVNAR